MSTPIPLRHPTTLACGFAAIEPEVFKTPAGTPYFKEAGVAMVGKTDFNLDAAAGFFESWDAGLGFMGYMADEPTDDNPGDLCKLAGQLCYLSFGERRTKNADAERYHGHIKESGHGSVYEHATYSFLLWGVDRALTHELVRHRAGFGFSQVSQRYCDGKTLRFVERPEYQVERIPSELHEALAWKTGMQHADFEGLIDAAREGYEARAYNLATSGELGHQMIHGTTGTARRKRVNQAARECLPNCTEAPIVVTGNARAWRNFVDQRASVHADVPIRELAVKVLRCLQHASPVIFGDYEIATGEDGVDFATSRWRKV